MKRRVSLAVEQLEARNTPSPVSSAGAFLPPGVIKGFNPQPDPPGLPPPVQVRDGSVAFLPPGIDRAIGNPDEAPPPVQVSRDGSVAFLPPGIDRAIGNPDEAPPPVQAGRDGLIALDSTGADQTHAFHASGTWAISIKGSHLEGTRSGLASPGGPFTGVFSGKWVNGSGAGVGMLDFGHGDTLTYDWQVKLDDATGLLLGTEVVTGGTGKFAGASGIWSSVGVPAGDGTGTFEYVGTLSY
jgi:hypothetical protein